MGFSIAHPEYLWLLLAIPLLVYLYRVHLTRKQQSIMKFSQLALLRQAQSTKTPSWRRHIVLILCIALIISLVAALADPHVPLKQTKEGVNVGLAIDVSGSMRADDYEPTRMKAAKLAASELIEDLKTNDKVGLVIFESGATTASYLTSLKDRAQDKLSSIEAKRGKTAIGDGLALAVDMVTSIPNKKKVIILLSDGVNNAGTISPKEAIGYADEENIQVHTVGMGSEGKTVIGQDMFGRPQYAKLDEELLQRIASETGGKYYKAVDDETLHEIYEGLSDEIEREKEDTSIKNWFIALALAIALALVYVMYGRYRIIQ